MNNQPIFDDGNGHLYQLTSVASDYDTAAAEAAANGGQLVSINNATENTYLTNAFGASGNLWIGYSDTTTEGTWLWNDANTSTYTNWAGVEPNGLTTENYAVLGTASGVSPAFQNAIGTWYDVAGASSFYGIIEYAVTVEQRIPWQTVEELNDFNFAVTDLHVTDPLGTNPDGSPVDGITYTADTTLTSDITLQEPSDLLGGTVLAGDTVIPDGTTLTYDVSLGSDLTLPFAISFPDGTTYAAGDTIPSGTTLPSGSTIPGGYIVPTGETLTLPAAVEVTLPAGAVVLTGTQVPAGTFLDNTLNNDSDTPIFNDAFTGISAGGDGSLTYSATLNDVDPDTGNYIPLPCWLSIDPVTGLFTGTAPYDHNNPDANTYQIRVVASDTVHGYSAEDSFQLDVSAHINQPPVEDDGGLYDVTFNEKASNSHTFTNPFTDPDRLAVLTYTAEVATLDLDGNVVSTSPLPNWLTFTPTTSDDPNTFTDDILSFSGRPLNGNVGQLHILVTANDGIYDQRGDLDNNGSIGTGLFTLTVDNTNDAPYIAHAIPDNVSNANPRGGATIYENDAYTYTVPTVSNALHQTVSSTSVFGDIDLPYGFNQSGIHQDEALTYSASLVNGKSLASLPNWLHFDPATKTFSNESAPGNYASRAGTYDIRVTATDAHGATAYDSFRLVINDVNDAPTGSSTATPADGTEDQTTYTISEATLLQGFSDADGANDRLGVVNATINSHASVTYNSTGVIGKGTFTITPDADYNGTVTLDYAVQDYTKASTIAHQVLKTDYLNNADTPASGHVNITFTAVNDAPVFVDIYNPITDVGLSATSIAAPSLSEDDGDNGQWSASISSDIWSSDSDFLPLVFTDVDSYDTHTATVSLISSDYHSVTSGSAIENTSTASSLGTLNVSVSTDSTVTIPASGAIDPNHYEGLVDWSYDLDGSKAAVDALGEGEYQVDKFNVTVTDNGTTNSVADPLSTVVNKEIDVTVYGTNDAPVLTGTAATLAHATEDSSYTINASDLLQGFTDVDHGDTNFSVTNLHASIDSASHLNGDIVDNGDGTFTVTPTDNYNGVINLTYQVDDGHSSNHLSTVTDQQFTIDPSEDAPSVNSALATQNATAGTLFVYDVQAATPISFKDPDIFNDGATHYVDTATAYTSSVITTPTDFSTTVDHLTFAVTSNVLVAGSNSQYVAAPSWVHIAAQDTVVGGVSYQAGTVYGTPATSDVVAAVPNQGLVAIRVIATDAMGLSVATYFNVNLGDNGTAGNDTITGGVGNDVISGLDGNDLLDGAAGNDSIYGGNGNDTLMGNTDDDYLDGGSGNDIFNGNQAGNDTILGGSGTDTLDYSASSDTINVDLTNTGLQTVGSVSGVDQISGIENLNGSQGNNFLKGDANNNVFNGYAGNDTLNGGNSNDTLNGGDNDDNLNGGGGDDKLDGGAGNDTFNGTQAGNDTIIGGTGTDTLDYSTSNDVIIVNLTTGNSISVTTAGVTPTAFSGNDTFSGIENVTGSSAANTLTGDASNNVLKGGAGDDTFFAGANGGGTDVYDGGTNTTIGDTVNYSTSTDAVTINLSSSVSQLVSTSQGSDTFSGIESIIGTGFADSLTTSNANSTLSGAAGNDSLTGGNGNDSLNGGANNDTLVGGAGSDTLNGAGQSDTITGDLGVDFFIFSNSIAVPTAVDTITDFSSVQGDKIELAKSIYSIFTNTGAITGLVEIKNAPIVNLDNTTDHLGFNSSTGALYYDVDGSATTNSAVQIATLTGVSTLSASDFIII
ncbi:MAG: cadherin-like domain-containing protein [Methylococcaceae bacterium]